MSFLISEEMGLVKGVTFLIPLDKEKPIPFWVPEPIAERLEARAAGRGLSVEEMLCELARSDAEYPILSEEEIKSFRQKDLHGCWPQFASLRPRIRTLHGLLAVGISLAILLLDLYDYWQ